MKIENLVVSGVLAFALAAMGFGVVLYPLYREVVGLRDENRKVKEELANAEYIIASIVRQRHHFCTASPIPDVRTKVVDTRSETGHVALGAGKDSGIREGFIFLIHRGDEYVGKVRVTTVWEQFSGGTIVERKKPLRAGDDAMTDTAPTP